MVGYTQLGEDIGISLAFQAMGICAYRLEKNKNFMQTRYAEQNINQMDCFNYRETIALGKNHFVFRCLKDFQLPLMQIIGGVAATAFPSVGLEVPMRYMDYWGSLSCYNACISCIPQNLSIERYVPIDDCYKGIINNVGFFLGITALRYAAQQGCPALFDIIEPMVFSENVLPNAVFLKRSLINGIDYTLYLMEAKRYVLVAAIILAALRFKPKNGAYFHYNNIWLYSGLGFLKFSAGLILSKVDETRMPVGGKNILSLASHCTLLPALVTVGYTLCNQQVTC